MEGLEFEDIEIFEKENIAELIHNSFFKDGNKEERVLDTEFIMDGIVDLKRTTNKTYYTCAYDYLYIIPCLIVADKLSKKIEDIIELSNSKFIPELKFNINRFNKQSKEFIKKINEKTAFIRITFKFAKYKDSIFTRITGLKNIMKNKELYNKVFNEIKDKMNEEKEKETDERKKAIYENIVKKIENNEISINLDTMDDLLDKKELDAETIEEINKFKESK